MRIHDKRLAGYIMRIFNLDWKLSKLKPVNKPLKLKPIQAENIINEAHPIELSYNKKPVFLYPTFSPIGYIYPGMVSDESAILKLINGAQKRVLIQLLTYNPDGYGTFYPTLDDALRKAALRGVKVKLLVSNWNLRKPGVNFLKSLQVIPNIQVKFSVIPQYSGGFIPFARVEHCKYLVVDNNLLWLGSSNWAKSYFYRSRNVGVVIRGQTVNSTVAKVFFKSWDSSYAEIINPCKNYKRPRISR
jgi:phosphatidylserine/phosphatidylglycerophosphate/cardiolipin synthase-like enzyme